MIKMEQLDSVKEILKLKVDERSKNSLGYLIIKYFGKFVIGMPEKKASMASAIAGTPKAFMEIPIGITTNNNLIIAEGNFAIVDVENEKAYSIRNFPLSSTYLKLGLKTLFEGFNKRNIDFIKFLTDCKIGKYDKYKSALTEITKGMFFYDEVVEVGHFIKTLLEEMDEYNPELISWKEVVRSIIFKDKNSNKIVVWKSEENKVREFFALALLKLI